MTPEQEKSLTQEERKGIKIALESIPVLSAKAPLQKKATQLIREQGIEKFEELCFHTANIIEQGAYWEDSGEFSLDHHDFGPRQVKRYRPESVEKAEQYLKDQGILEQGERKTKVIEFRFNEVRAYNNQPELNILKIPTEGPLPLILREEYFWQPINNFPLEPTAKKSSFKIRTSVLIDKPCGPVYERKIHAVWIKERNEWIGIVYEWSQEEPRGTGDEHYRGPFALDEFCLDKIIEVYGIDKSTLEFEQVRSLSPENLAKLSSSQ